jgi:hypothetical protein
MTKFNPTIFRKMLFAGSVFLLGACGDNLPQTGPGGLSPDDAAALDDAAEKLDAKTLPPPAPPAPPAPALPATSATPAKQPVRSGASGKDK